MSLVWHPFVKGTKNGIERMSKKGRKGNWMKQKRIINYRTNRTGIYYIIPHATGRMVVALEPVFTHRVAPPWTQSPSLFLCHLLCRPTENKNKKKIENGCTESLTLELKCSVLTVSYSRTDALLMSFNRSSSRRSFSSLSHGSWNLVRNSSPF